MAISFEPRVLFSSLSEIDQKTIHLRGAMGTLKPENPDEINECLDALKNGASKTLEFWKITDHPKAIEFRKAFGIHEEVIVVTKLFSMQKGCPYCGCHVATIPGAELTEVPLGTEFVVKCTFCGSKGPPSGTEPGAISLWENGVLGYGCRS